MLSRYNEKIKLLMVKYKKLYKKMMHHFMAHSPLIKIINDKECNNFLLHNL